MTHTDYFMAGSYKTGYLKLLYTPRHLGIGVDLDFEDEGWELTIHLLCFQVWIGA